MDLIELCEMTAEDELELCKLIALPKQGIENRR